MELFCEEIVELITLLKIIVDQSEYKTNELNRSKPQDQKSPKGMGKIYEKRHSINYLCNYLQRPFVRAKQINP